MITKTYWDNRYISGGNSGYGSYGEQLAKKLDWLKDLDFHTVVDVGCGDFNFGKSLLELHPAAYLGFDISEVIVAKNRRNYPGYSFNVLGDSIPSGDLTLCLDVLFHVIEDEECEKLLKLFDGSKGYLAVTAYEYDRPSDNHVVYRKFDYKRFGEPLIREVVEEDGQLYFYLFKR